jgi:soluble lytic murein transglycosylase-like protein
MQAGMTGLKRLLGPAVLGVLVLAACSSPSLIAQRTQTIATPPANGQPAVVPSASASAVPAVLPAPDPLADLAAALRVVEVRIRDYRTHYTQLPALAESQQTLYQQLVLHPAWMTRVISLMPPDLKAVVQDNVAAISQIRTLNGVRSALPRWRIVEPPDPDVLLTDYQQAQSQYGVPWQYLAAIHLIETSMSRIQGTSSAGALGPMQFMPGTWAIFGRGDVNNPHDAIMAAARYLRASGAPGNMRRAIYSYNNSWLYVNAVTAYATVMQSDPRAFFGYYFWQVYVLTPSGDVVLPQGFGS